MKCLILLVFIFEPEVQLHISTLEGKFEYWVAALKPGVVIFELDVESEEPKPD